MPEESKRTNFLNLLVKTVPYKYNLKKYRTNKRPVEQLAYEIDDSHRFRNSVYVYNAPGQEKTEKKKVKYTEPLPAKQNSNDQKLYAVDLVKWEDDIFDISSIHEEKKQQHKRIIDVETKEYVNKLLETNWEDNIIYDEMPTTNKPLVVYADDPNLIFEPVEKKQKTKKKNVKNTNFDKPLKNKYNVSLDKYYENETKTKTSLVTFGVQHSAPALKLHAAFFRLNLTKEELRNFHKPSMDLLNKEFVFSKPLQITVGASIIKKPYEISCNDLSEFVVFEYSEENPLFVVNPGMVSVKSKYYRKIDSNDECDQKNIITLEPEEEGPFLNYGEIPKGEFGECLDNNLFVAPIFKHKVSDYLVIATESKLIYKKITKAYVVGQEFPKEEIYTPHSRKYTQFCKDQVKVYAHRVFAKNPEMFLSQFDAHLPCFSDNAKRKWLKEFTDMSKKGKDTIFTLKQNSLQMNEEELRKMITPENICQFQSMMSGERRLEDLGYKILDDQEDDLKYTPNWILCRNFVNATNGKGLLELKGRSDPTGMGEGFSFDRMKFRKANETDSRKLMSEHQANYKNIISQIWNKQWKSLSNPVPPHKPEADAFTETQKSVTNDNSFNEDNSNKTLTIIRSYVENGQIVEKTEVLTDSKLIKAYLRARKKVKPDDKKTSLRCSSCGQVGHMKTNKNCSNYTGGKKAVKEKKKAKICLHEKFSRLISQFQAIPYSSPFHRPVSYKKFPMYKTVVKNNMDFLKMKTKIKSGEYTKFDMFLDDIVLIHENCKLFNGPTHSLSEISHDFVEKTKKYKVENYIELTELEQKIEKDE